MKSDTYDECKKELQTQKKYYFLGIGGISMSALALLLNDWGVEVSGYDETPSRASAILEENKIKVDFKFFKKKIDENDIIVYSSAIKENNPLFCYAKEKQKIMLSRGQLLGKISQKYQKVIAISGSHGKTTTTAMIYEILKIAGKNPTLHLGGFRIEDEKNLEIGENEYFVTEACEYHDNFLFLNPYIAVVLNVEKEHLDYFKTFERQLASFEKFKKQSQIVVESQNNLKAKNIRHNKDGYLSFSLYNGKQKIMRLNLQICEEINTQNCIFAYQVAKKLQIPDCLIKQGLENFKGVSTRFEKKECQYFDNVICDYAHHPTELSKAIFTAKKIFKNKTIVTVFQPHTYSRTKLLLSDFLDVFKNIDLPLFYKTYSARENSEEGVSAKDFTEILQKDNKNAQYFDNFECLQKFLLKLNRKDVVLLFLGAGDLPAILHKNNFIS